MKKVLLNVVHPLTGKTVLVETTESITVEELVQKLVACCFLQEGVTYSLTIKNGEETVVCEPAKKMEDYQVSDGSILEVMSKVRANGDQVPEKEDYSAALCPKQGDFSAAADPQQDDSITARDKGGPRIRIKSEIGIDPEQIPQIDLSKWMDQVKDTPLSEALIMLLQYYKALLEKNEENKRLHKNESMKMRDEREKLENKVRGYEKKFEEKKTGTIVVAISNIIIGVGTAFLTTNYSVAFPVMGAGVVITGLGLWLSFK